MKIACIGEVMIELSPAGEGLMRAGVAGDSFNTAVYLSRLLGPSVVSYVTALGCDPQSDRIMDAIAAEGIATELCERVPDGLPGLYMITLDDRGERSFAYWRSTSAARGLFSRAGGIRPGALAGFDVIYLSAITLAVIAPEARARLLDWFAGFRARGGKVAFDSNYRPRLWPDAETARTEIGRFWSVTDIALPSLDDEEALTGVIGSEATVARFRALGVGTGALKRGAAGPVSLDGSGAALRVPRADRVTDTTAAGDSFNAGFIAATLTGASATAAMAAGHALAARVIAHPGAIIPRAAMPTA